jgi:Protein of unknown function (DUF669)
MAKFGFDTAEVDVSAPAEYDPIPEGEYVLKALDAEEKSTSRGDGSYIKAKFEVVKGEHAGRLLWQNFNINNPSEKAQRIGRQQLVAWATACGRPEADDTDKLLEKPFRAAVGVEPASNGYKASNKIKAFLFDDAPAAAAPKAAPAPKPAPKAAAPSRAPAASANPWD